LHCDLGSDAGSLAQALYREGVSVRPMGTWGMPGSLRISIGNAEQNRALIDALRRIRG